jgi:glutaredoxin-like protein NrdH
MFAFTVVDGPRDIGDIKIFALSTCVWCKRAKAFFGTRGIRYSYIDVDTLDYDAMADAKAMQRQFNPRGSYPTVVIDESTCIVGYDEQKLLELYGEK